MQMIFCFVLCVCDIFCYLLSANGKPVILLLFNAGPLDITQPKMDTRVSAIMECFFPAQATGEALTQVLSGKVVPAGRLQATWPANLQQVSVHWCCFTP